MNAVKRLNIFNTDIAMQTCSERSWSASLGTGLILSLPPQARAGAISSAHLPIIQSYFYFKASQLFLPLLSCYHTRD
ncbi:MAG: hypothetical protein WB014_04445 [Methanosarcina sp.]